MRWGAEGHCERRGRPPKLKPTSRWGGWLRDASQKNSRLHGRKVLEWHSDKLETMADELKAYANRRTARINEAYHLLRQRL